MSLYADSRQRTRGLGKRSEPPVGVLFGLESERQADPDIRDSSTTLIPVPCPPKRWNLLGRLDQPVLTSQPPTLADCFRLQLSSIR